MATKKRATKKRATKKSAAKKRAPKKNACAVSLGSKGGKKTLALGRGIFADVYIRKRKKASKKRSKK